MLDYPSLYLKKDLKQKLAIQIASNISRAANFIVALSKTVDKALNKKYLSNIY